MKIKRGFLIKMAVDGEAFVLDFVPQVLYLHCLGPVYMIYRDVSVARDVFHPGFI